MTPPDFGSMFAAAMWNGIWTGAAMIWHGILSSPVTLAILGGMALLVVIGWFAPTRRRRPRRY